MISIIDYGAGNLGSIKNMFEWINVESEIISDLDKIERAKKILLPGVGAFDSAIKKIRESGFDDVLNYKALDEKIPVLGICLGMQLLTDSSEEGELPGFGWIPGTTKRFDMQDKSLKVPHMGWNRVFPQKECSLIKGIGEEPRFYFVHSYYVEVKDEQNKLLETTYGNVTFDSAIHKENIYGAQFHPEKSHKYGMQLFKNFANL